MVELYFIKIKNEKLKSESFARKILGEYLCVDGDSLVICKNEFGKPYLVEYPDIHYNISHTTGVLVCAVSDKPVGIDIERVKKINKRVVGYFFTENEQNYIYAHKENQDERFAEIWTKKEAYFKLIETGITASFSTFDILKLFNDAKMYTKKNGDCIFSVCHF